MSNTRKAKWTAAEVTAANAEQLLTELAGVVAIENDPKTRSMLLEAWDALDAQGRAAEFPELAAKIRTETARKVVGGRFLADLERAGHDPGLIATAEQKLTELGEDFWAGIYQQIVSGAS